MMSFRYAILSLLALSTLTKGFFIYTPTTTTPKPAQEPSMGDYISRGFSKRTVDSPGSISRLAIKKRFINEHALGKRVNGYKIVTAAEPTQTNSVALDQDGTDFSYFSEVKLGSKGDTFYMLVDTGAADTWIMGTGCKSTACKTHSTFGKENSDTITTTSSNFSLKYGTGDVSGMIVKDTIGIAGMNVPLMFGVADTTSDDFNNYPMDGILGLGRSGSDVFKGPTFMEALRDAKLIPALIFGINMNRQVDGTTDGEINFGAADTSKFKGDLVYTDAVPDGKFWEIPVDDAVVDGTPLQLSGNTAVIDTGTSYMLIPPADAKKLHAKIPGSKPIADDTFSLPCDSKTSVQLVFSKVAYDISPKDYIGKKLDGDNVCISHIIGFQYKANQWLVGDIFLKNVYTVFDWDKARIGFAARAPTGSATSSSTSPSSSSTVSSSNSSPVAATPTTSGVKEASSAPSPSPLLPGKPADGSSTSKPGSSTASAVPDTSGPGSTITSASGSKASSTVAPTTGSGMTIRLSSLVQFLMFGFIILII